ncbi:hypothetical protein [Duganella violaceipulchra]|uniref:Uncharacterized protein n=1 Tax=Duganella violaceipulchra TaxID=2849652 RepID=A0AA41H687_9BURK|nr:hypothetical protein [Duganella violaceicalia]MBV6322657.1 hypothetical protein [Duganella violaceicalia]MCP2010871.1 hypothetical protein [Duganella violaceicalia]
MSQFYTDETLVKTESLVSKSFHTEAGYTHRLAEAVLDGIAAHGLDANDWDTIVETVKVVVKSWVANGALKNESIQ